MGAMLFVTLRKSIAPKGRSYKSVRAPQAAEWTRRLNRDGGDRCGQSPPSLGSARTQSQMRPVVPSAHSRTTLRTLPVLPNGTPASFTMT